MSPLFYVGIALLAGLLLTRVVKPLHLPNVTGYLVAGVLIGPFVGGIFHKEHLESLALLTDVALGFIAFSIGNEFRLSDMKKLGSAVFVIALFESFTAVFLVTGILLAIGVEAPVAICLGAIASSTAPAATLLIIRQYKADGPVTRTLLPVVALDDAACLIAYSIAVSIARGMVSSEGISLSSSLIHPLTQIASSLLLGLALGVALSFACRFFKGHNNRVALALVSVFLGVSLAMRYDLSSLLLCMMIGGAYINLRDEAEKIMHYVDEWTAPLFILFFVLSGAELDIRAVGSVGLIGILYVVFRAGGKWVGASIAGKICHSDKNVVKYLGLTLMPQAGVAIGMARLVVNQLPAYGGTIQTVILSATLIYEFIGPLAAKYALQKAGEITTQ